MSHTEAIKIYVAGHRGMVGSAISRHLAATPSLGVSSPGHGAVIPGLTRDPWIADQVRNDIDKQRNDTPAVIAGTDPQSMPPEVPVVRIDRRYFRPTEVEPPAGRPHQS